MTSSGRGFLPSFDCTAGCQNNLLILANRDGLRVMSSGSVTLKVVPLPGLDVALILPPHGATMERTSDRPSPLPGTGPRQSARKPRSYIRDIASFVMPMPVSATVRATPLRMRTREISTLPPSFVYFTALLTRLRTTESRSLSTPLTTTRSFGGLHRSETPPARAMSPSVSTTSDTTAARSTLRVSGW